LILDKILPSRVRDSYPTPLVGVPKIIVIEGVGVVKMAARALPMSNPTQLLITGPADATLTVVLAHGAGAGMRSDFMNAFAEGLAAEHIRAVRFEFPYMAARQQSASKRPPDREPVLRKSWQQVIDQLAAESLVIGGKSMGGRIASLVADEVGVAGLVCLGYPFHPIGKPAKLRVEHLRSLNTPTLIIQGERDPFGNRAEVATYGLAPTIEVHWIADGDHSFKPRKASGHTQQGNWRQAITAVAEFVKSLKK
jgi:hypothetical protein